MSNDTTLVEEAPPERPEESAPQAEITKLATQHADRVRELEADRWRLSERIEALENQNAGNSKRASWIRPASCKLP